MSNKLLKIFIDLWEILNRQEKVEDVISAKWLNLSNFNAGKVAFCIREVAGVNSKTGMPKWREC